MTKKITQEYLKECVTYDLETGIFVWNERPLHHFNDDKVNKAESMQKTWNTKFSNKQCKTFKSGYIVFTISNNRYYAHRLAFLYMEGYIPEHEIDHIDRNRQNNKWNNLRHVTSRCNKQNKSPQSNNTSGVVGVNWSKHANMWNVRLCIDKKTKQIGYFKNFNDAVLARYNEEQNNKNWSCSTDSSAYSYLKENKLLK